MTDEALKAIKKRDKLRVELDYINNNDTRKEFNTARNKARQLTNQARHNFVQGKLNKVKTSQKKFWSELKTLMPSKKDKGSNANDMIILTDENNHLFDDEQKAADFANSYFFNIGPQLSDLICYNNNDYLKKLEDSYYNPISLNYFEPVTEKEILELVKNMDTSKSSNVKDINNKFLKLCLLSTTPQICYLFNLIFETAIIPPSWKYATIVPLFKEGKKTDIANYRPISLLSQLAKLLEKTLHTRMYHFLDNYDILCPEQGGFLPKLSTNDTIGGLLSDIYSNLNKRNNTIAIFYDLKKAIR